MAEKYSFYHDYVGKWVVVSGHGVSVFGKLVKDSLDTLVFSPVVLNEPILMVDEKDNVKSRPCYRIEEKEPSTMDIRAVELVEPASEERARYLVEVTRIKSKDSISE